MYQTLDDLESGEKNQTGLSIWKKILKIFLKWLLWIIILFFWFMCLVLWQYISYLWYNLFDDYFMVISLIISFISMIVFIFMTIKFFNTQDVEKRKTRKFIIILSIIILILSLPSALEFLLEYVDYLLIILISMFLIWLIAFITVFIIMLITKNPIKKHKLKWVAIVTGVISLISCCGFYLSLHYIRSSALKPIIYLYPNTKIEANVKLWKPQNLSHTYPKYNSEKWRNVVAQPNGDLEDMDTWRKLYALYREWKSDNETNFDEWFVVAWKDIIRFLEEKLAILWLNERESEEFIVYRLPQMEDNKYNLIRFETKAEQDENMPLNITPKPDTVIRVMMDRKTVDELINIPEQQLVSPERSWFTVVERWGSPRN